MPVMISDYEKQYASFEDRLLFNKIIFDDPAIMTVMLPEYLAQLGAIKEVAYDGSTKSYVISFNRKKSALKAYSGMHPIDACSLMFRDALFNVLTQGYGAVLIEQKRIMGELPYIEAYDQIMQYIYDPNKLFVMFKTFGFDDHNFLIKCG